ncbi:hypothetical protein [Bacillus sp. WP8]|nr:hypothetical protein [Bacillus sp. WP8]
MSERDEKEGMEEYLETDGLKDLKVEDRDEGLIGIGLLHGDEKR